MGVRILEDKNGMACLYCSVTDYAFGPVFDNGSAEANLFLEWLPRDAREYQDNELVEKYSEFRLQYSCFWCSGFFINYEEAWRVITGERYCSKCKKEKHIKDEDAVKEWRVEEDSIEFTPYGKYEEEE